MDFPHPLSPTSPYGERLELNAAGKTFVLRAVAQKKGAVAFVCDVTEIPDKPKRLKIDRELSKRAFEHIVIYATDSAQVWNWPRRVPDRPLSLMDHAWTSGAQNTGFIQRLHGLRFTLEAENDLTLPDVTKKLDASLNAERVTKRFFTEFSSEHRKFLAFIGGIADVADREWYASLMLNRLMFIYFMQKKGFLDGNADYLRDKLAECQSHKGRGTFFSFYRYFLLRLCHEGLGGRQRNRELEKLIGQVPYLNGGLFEKHPVEERNPDIEIPDEAFERIFTYFDRYKWHLDERPLRDDNEINPDVLGYIFEKYINQKQMGAYYTKEDITGYITQNTVIPFLFDAAKVSCRVAFENPGGPTVWDYLRDDPDRYIYQSVRHGVNHALPDSIVAGIGDPSRRTEWNRTAPEEIGLPTEIWREVVARRTRCEELRSTLASGAVRDVNELITLNLDIRQFAQDVIDRAEGPDLLRAMWKAIERVTVLDPTCGSGAFLFAALNVLEPLYEACLDRMDSFVTDLERSEGGQIGKRYEDFRKCLVRVKAHPNRRYFILKSIILNNLFGVDIMEEAVEICKLRLFLKLAAQVDPDKGHRNLGIEPLPDIDFNVRAGNTLVGYATYSEIQAALGSKLDFDDNIGRVTQAAADLQQAADAFRARQVDGDGSVPATDKATLRERLNRLEGQLNRQLASEYGVTSSDAISFAAWVERHEPFHWFVEYYGIMSRGGFDVIIGNPPYVEYSKIRPTYSVRGYESLPSGNLFAMSAERSFMLSAHGRTGLVLPVSAVCTDRTISFQRLLLRRDQVWVSSFDVFPARLFEGAAQRLAIVLTRNTQGEEPRLLTSAYRRWFAAERAHLMTTLSYWDVSEWASPGWLPRIGSEADGLLLKRITGRPLAAHIKKVGDAPIYAHRIVNNFVKAVDFPPTFQREGEAPSVSPDFKRLYVDEEHRLAILALLNSSVFYWYWRNHGDGFHCGFKDIGRMPVHLDSVSDASHSELSVLGTDMSDALREHSSMKVRNQKKTGRVELQTFQFSPTKPAADAIDRNLGKYHYGFSETDVDYVVNHDIKYRVGQQDDDEGVDEFGETTG